MTINNADTGEIRRIVQQQYGQRASASSNLPM